MSAATDLKSLDEINTVSCAVRISDDKIRDVVGEIRSFRPNLALVKHNEGFLLHVKDS